MATFDDTTNPSRRAILTGIPAAAIGIGAVSAAGLAALAISDEISQLLEIERRLAAINEQIEAQCLINESCGRALFRARAKYTHPIRYDDEDDARTLYHYRRQKARYDATRERMAESSGLRASEDRLKQLREEQHDVGSRVWEIKATSVEALKIKARMSQNYQAAGWSAVNDLLEL